MVHLTPAMKKFILHWGEMGTRWGINRTVAQIHALLYLSPEPLTAEDIATTLAVARSNVSTSLRELQGWGLVRVVHILGDRRDHFESLKDVWEMFWIVMDGRKQREIDPTLKMLRESVANLGKDEPIDAHTQERLAAMLDFLETMASSYEVLRGLPVEAMGNFVKVSDKVRILLGGGKR